MRFSSSSSSSLPVGSAADGRDTLLAMIRQEEKFYRCPNYLNPDDCDYEDNQSSLDSDKGCVPPPSSIIAEIAGLVTDVRFVPPLHPPAEKQPQQERQLQEDNCYSTPKNNKKQLKECSSPVSVVQDLHGVSQQNLHPSTKKKRRRPSPTEVSCLSNWRHRMFDWECSVCKAFRIEEYSRVLAVAFSILDRYLAIELLERDSRDDFYRDFAVSKEEFQLLCMVSMCIAAKNLLPSNRNKLTFKTMVEMAQGFYSEEDMKSTELEILLALDWHVNPPTVMDYCTVYLSLFPMKDSDLGCDKNSRDNHLCTIRRQCEYLAELTMDDLFFLGKSSSVVALALVVLATNTHIRSHGALLPSFLQNIQGIVNIHDSEFDTIFRRLEYFC